MNRRIKEINQQLIMIQLKLKFWWEELAFNPTCLTAKALLESYRLDFKRLNEELKGLND